MTTLKHRRSRFLFATHRPSVALYDPDGKVKDPDPDIEPDTIALRFGKGHMTKYRRHLLAIGTDACFYCGCGLTDENATLDHVVPRSRGGADAPFNLQLCCKDCNTFKGDRTPLEWLAKLSSRIERLTTQAEALEGRIETEHLHDFIAHSPRKRGKAFQTTEVSTP